MNWKEMLCTEPSWNNENPEDVRILSDAEFDALYQDFIRRKQNSYIKRRPIDDLYKILDGLGDGDTSDILVPLNHNTYVCATRSQILIAISELEAEALANVLPTAQEIWDRQIAEYAEEMVPTRRKRL